MGFENFPALIEPRPQIPKTLLLACCCQGTFLPRGLTAKPPD
jgi:hypothetical protein